MSTPSKDYTLKNIETIFNKIGYPEGGLKALRELNFRNELTAPGVKTVLFSGKGLPTTAVMRFKNEEFD